MRARLVNNSHDTSLRPLRAPRVTGWGMLILVALIAPWLDLVAGGGQEQPTIAKAPFSDFQQRVQEYVTKQRSRKSSLPALRTTRKPEEIEVGEDALARAIRDSRPNARQGDIFSPEIARQFRQAILSKFDGANAARVRKTVRQGESPDQFRLAVNASYPKNLPLATVPPTLLLILPQLPEEVSYRIIGHDFVLQDTKARLIIDFIPGVVP